MSTIRKVNVGTEWGMGRRLQRLTAKGIETTRRAGYWADGGGLYLQVTATRAKSWIFRFQLRGRAREMGLGSLNAVSLLQARQKAAECRRLLADGVDPLEARRAQDAAQALAEARSLTFRQCGETYIKAHTAGWRNGKHADQWTNTLQTYAYPVIGSLPVADVDTALVLRILEPIWTAKHETATRVRARIEAVLDWATARGYRAGDNPARWRGHLEKLLPEIKKKERVRHHPALPYGDMSEFMAKLRKQEGIAPLALEFTILTAARTGEVIGARPEEFDLDKAVWTVPARRTKAHREHRVPLAPRALAIVREQIEQGGEYVFPGGRKGEPLSGMAMLMLLRRMGRAEITVHGFRSAFKDWASEETSFPNIVSEAALAHVVGDATEAAYRRGSLFQKRQQLMAAWAKFCDRREKGKVVALRA